MEQNTYNLDVPKKFMARSSNLLLLKISTKFSLRTKCENQVLQDVKWSWDGKEF